eukprot:941467-Prymnesium_polylepis.2
MLRTECARCRSGDRIPSVSAGLARLSTFLGLVLARNARETQGLAFCRLMVACKSGSVVEVGVMVECGV